MSAEFWGWTSLVTTGTAFLFGLIFIARKLPQESKPLRRDIYVALLSGLVYVLTAVPLIVPSLWQKFDRNLKEDYLSVPFRFALVMTPTVGSLLSVSAYFAKGTLVAMTAIVLVNYLVPGGVVAGVVEENSWTGWLGKGSGTYAAWIFSAVFVYFVCLSRWHQSTKVFCLLTFSPSIVCFLNPQCKSAKWNAFTWHHGFHWDLTGPVISSIVIDMAALPLAALSLPMLPCSRRSRRFFSCYTLACEGLSNIATDTVGSLERLITYFSEHETWFDMGTSDLHIGKLGASREKVEALLEQAKWECHSDATRTQVRCLSRVAGLMHALRQGLLVQLSRARQLRSNEAYKYNVELEPHLNTFLHAMRDCMCSVVTESHMQRGLTKEDFEQVRAHAEAADAALRDAFDVLPRGDQTELIFIDGLCNFPDALGSFAEQGIATLEEVPQSWRKRFTLREWCSDPVCCKRERHITAIRNASAWLLGLAWSTWTHRPACVSTVSVVLSPGLGSLFDRNVNRILGVGIGLVVGNLPAVLLIRLNCYGNHCFENYPSGPVVYGLLMFTLWSVSIYGALAAGSKFPYACKMWAGFGGVQMLQNLHTALAMEGDMLNSELLVSTMDNTLGCFIVLGIDVFASQLQSRRSIDMVAQHISQCVLDLCDVLGRLKNEDRLRVSSDEWRAFDGSVKEVRHWRDEARKEDFVWTVGGSLQFSRCNLDLADAALKQVLQAHTALWSLLTVAHRSEQRHRMKSIARACLPAGLASRCKIYSRALRAAIILEDFDPDDPDYKVEGLRADRRCDSVRSIASDRNLRTGEGEEGEGDDRMAAPDWAAIAVMRANCCDVRLALLQLQAALEEDDYWQAQDEDLPWQAQDGEPAESEESGESEESEESPRLWLRNQRKWYLGPVRNW